MTARDLGPVPERGTESVLRAVCLRLGCTAAAAVFEAAPEHQDADGSGDGHRAHEAKDESKQRRGEHPVAFEWACVTESRS